MTIAQFGEYQFGLRMVFSELEIMGESEIEEKIASNQKYVEQKNGKPCEITLKAILHAGMNIDVEATARAMVNSAQRGQSDYLYVGGRKLFPFQLMLTKAVAGEIHISTGGKWVTAEVELTMKQSTKDWISGNAPTETSTKISVKQEAIIDAVSMAQPASQASSNTKVSTIQAWSNKIKGSVKTAVSNVTSVIQTAKKTQSPVKNGATGIVAKAKATMISLKS